jgi:hypothetical protein
MNNQQRLLREEVWITPAASTWVGWVFVVCDGRILWMLGKWEESLPVIQF